MNPDAAVWKPNVTVAAVVERDGRFLIYMRFAFTGEDTGHDKERTLDTGILRAAWLTPEQIRASRVRHRTPLVIRCVEDYLAGRRYPLELITHYA